MRESDWERDERERLFMQILRRLSPGKKMFLLAYAREMLNKRAIQDGYIIEKAAGFNFRIELN